MDIGSYRATCGQKRSLVNINKVYLTRGFARYVDVANAQSKTLRDRRQIFSMMIKLARYFQS